MSADIFAPLCREGKKVLICGCVLWDDNTNAWADSYVFACPPNEGQMKVVVVVAPLNLKIATFSLSKG